MRWIISAIFFILVPMLYAFSKSHQHQERTIKEAENFGKQQNQKTLNTINQFVPESFIPIQERHQAIEPERLRKEALSLSEGDKSKATKKMSNGTLFNLLSEQIGHQAELNGFSIDLSGLVKEEAATDNEKLTSILTKLSVFKEIKKELENACGADARMVTLFSGTEYKCSRNVLNNTLYDCCGSMGGLATAVSLAKCDAEEIALAKMREEGRCHYVGKFDKRAAGLIKRSERGIFCCFSSKLACVMQEQARLQLRRGWGKVRKPDCSGLTLDEIKRLDFTQLDLSKAVPTEVLNQSDFQNRLQSFQKKIRESDIQPTGD